MSDDETTPEMLTRLGTDAVLWAQEFNKTAVKLGYSEMDEGWLIGWFANAIENSDVIRCNQLRAELAAEREQKFRHMDNATKLCNELISIRAENEKLREALKPLAAITLWTDKYPDGPLSVGDNQRYIDPQWIVRARAALEGVMEPTK